MRMFNSFHREGVKAFNANNYGIAKDFFLQAIHINPEVAESYFYLGKCFFFCDEKLQAISHLTKFIELKQSNLDEMAVVSYAYDLLGQCYEALNKDDAALISYETATTVYPTCASAWNNMGLLYIKSALNLVETAPVKSQKLFKESLIYIKKALGICSDNPVFLQSVASWYEQYIEVLERIIEDEQALQRNIASNFCEAIYYYQKALSVSNDKELALRNIILSNLTECMAQYGHFVYRNKDYKKAQEIYLEALHLDPVHLVVINQIGMCLFKQACYPEARKYFSSLLDKTKDNQEIADAWLNIACTYRLEKHWDSAEEALSQARKFAPEDLSIKEEEITLNETKLSSIHVSAPQILFASSKDDENKQVHESSFQFDFN